jgi:hypothetical protein
MKRKLFFTIALLCAVCSVFGQTPQKKPATKPAASSAKTDQAKAAKPQHPKLAIEYFAEYNLFEDEFATNHSENSYYTFDEAKQVCPDGWHNPSMEEWAAIFPYDNRVRFDSGSQEVEPISVNGIKKDYFAKYVEKEGVRYAIRFMRDPNMEMDNKMLCAYHYQLVGNAEKSDIRLKVTVRYLGPAFKGTLDDVANETYWATNNKEDVVREFPLAGYIPSKGTIAVGGKGMFGRYWTSHRLIAANFQSYYGRCIQISGPNGIITTNWGTWEGGYDEANRSRYTVRCIKDKEEQ